MRLLLAGLALLMFAACGGGGDSPVPPIEIAVLRLEGNFYGNWPVQSYVARTDSEWSRIWDLHDPMQSPVPARPVVDFAAYTIAGISQGWGPTGCDGLVILRITDEPEQVRVAYRRLVVPAFAVCTASLVPLLIFVKIPATAKPIVFEPAP